MQPPKKEEPEPAEASAEGELERHTRHDKIATSQPSIWPMIASMDYLIGDLAALSPMSAYFLRMARQNLLDEYLPGSPTADRADAPDDPDI